MGISHLLNDRIELSLFYLSKELTIGVEAIHICVVFFSFVSFVELFSVSGGHICCFLKLIPSRYDQVRISLVNGISKSQCKHDIDSVLWVIVCEKVLTELGD